VLQTSVSVVTQIRSPDGQVGKEVSGRLLFNRVPNVAGIPGLGEEARNHHRVKAISGALHTEKSCPDADELPDLIVGQVHVAVPLQLCSRNATRFVTMQYGRRSHKQAEHHL
jgi:hypothetical protein